MAAASDVKSLTILDKEANAEFPVNVVQTSRYNVVNFLPLFLLEQLNPFNKVANFYFLIVAVLQCIPSISITAGLPTVLVPLVFVLFVEGVSVAIEDWNRHKADAEANGSPTMVFSKETSTFVETTWKDVRVGDVVKVKDGEIFPADLVFLRAGDKAHPGHCQINTKSLDGETDNKLRLALKTTANLLETPGDVAALTGRVECELPNENTSDFQGTLLSERALAGGKEAIEINNMLLRGCILKNVPFVLGLVVSTAVDTKIEFSSRDKAAGGKTASINQTINKQIMILAVIEAVLCLVGGTGFAIFNADNHDRMLYFQWSNEGFLGWFGMVFTYFLLSYQLIPVSLYVSMSMVYTIQRFFMINDLRMYFEFEEEPCMVRTMNLNDELGQISYIFSDKTGTLTSNLMEFRKAWCGGVPYGLGTTEIGLARMKAANMNTEKEELLMEEEERRPPRRGVKRYVNFVDGSEDDESRRLMDDIAKRNSHAELLQGFAINMAVNHTVFLAETRLADGSKVPDLSASSPDEQAFVAAAAEWGYEFVDRQTDAGTITLKYPDGSRHTFEILEVLEYVSYRKRMSVIVREGGQIYLFCKGADSVIFERLANGQSKLMADMREKLGVWAEDALRTLVFGSRKLSNNQYTSWQQQYMNAKNDAAERTKRKAGKPNRIDELMSEIESELILQGASALEDKLQQGVPRTLARLGEAGISIWMITGDKVGTAKNIAVACSILDEEHMDKFELTEDSMNDTELTSDQLPLMDLKGKSLVDAQNLKDEERSNDCATMLRGLEKKFPALERIRRELAQQAAHIRDGKQTAELAMVIDEKAIDYALLDCHADLLYVARHCKSVVACRARKDQKKKLLELIRYGVEGTITLGIGDGANDVDMIRAGHVGIGVIGKEGMQAVNNSDYAIGQFKYLEHLLLRHGRSNYRRMSKLVCFMFYKNVLIVAAQALYQAFAGFSGQKFYAEMGLQFYNTAFTALLVIFMAVYDEDVQSTTRTQKDGSKVNYVLDFPALYRSCVRQEHFTSSIFWGWQLSALFNAVLVFFLCYWGLPYASADGSSPDVFELGSYVFTTLIFVANFKIALETRKLHWFYILTLVLSDLSWFLCAAIISVLPSIEPQFFGMVQHLFSSGSFWLLQPLAVVACLLRDVAWKVLRREFDTQYYHRVQEVEKFGLDHSLIQMRPESKAESSKPSSKAERTEPSPSTPGVRLGRPASGSSQDLVGNESPTEQNFSSVVQRTRGVNRARSKWRGSRTTSLFDCNDASAQTMASVVSRGNYGTPLPRVPE